MSDRELIKPEEIQNRIYAIRGLQVMLDKDLAVFYDVKPIRLREQVKRNYGAEAVKSRVVDILSECFRRFSGHTQGNATDLRLMKYPYGEMLIYLGKWAAMRELSQEEIDRKIGNWG